MDRDHKPAHGRMQMENHRHRFVHQTQQRPENEASQAAAGGLLGLDGGRRAFASARAIAEDLLPDLGRTYLGAGAQGPQASVTSRTKQLEHSLFISWINLLSRVSKSYRQCGWCVKGGVWL